MADLCSPFIPPTVRAPASASLPELFQGFSRGLLLGLLFAPALAPAHDSPADSNLCDEALFVVRPDLPHYSVIRRSVKKHLANLLQAGLVILLS